MFSTPLEAKVAYLFAQLVWKFFLYMVIRILAGLLLAWPWLFFILVQFYFKYDHAVWSTFTSDLWGCSVSCSYVLVCTSTCSSCLFTNTMHLDFLLRNRLTNWLKIDRLSIYRLDRLPMWCRLSWHDQMNWNCTNMKQRRWYLMYKHKLNHLKLVFFCFSALQQSTTKCLIGKQCHQTWLAFLTFILVP